MPSADGGPLLGTDGGPAPGPSARPAREATP